MSTWRAGLSTFVSKHSIVILLTEAPSIGSAPIVNVVSPSEMQQIKQEIKDKQKELDEKIQYEKLLSWFPGKKKKFLQHQHQQGLNTLKVYQLVLQKSCLLYTSDAADD